MIELLMAHDGDAHARHQETHQRKEKPAAKVAQDFAQLQIKPALEQNQHQCERAESVRRPAKNVRIDPVQHRPDQHAREHQNDHIGHAGESHEPVRDECQHEQATKHREK
jgi:hypothetical protein